MREVLIVFESDKDEKDYVLNNKVNDHVHTGSVIRGAGSIPLKRKGVVFNTVMFVKKDYCDGRYYDFALYLDRFIRDLIYFKLVDEDTKFI